MTQEKKSSFIARLFFVIVDCKKKLKRCNAITPLLLYYTITHNCNCVIVYTDFSK